MSKIVVLGATGSLGKHVIHQAVAAGHEVSALVRTPAKLPAELRDKVAVLKFDLANARVAELREAIGGHDVVINTAGLVTAAAAHLPLVNLLVPAFTALVFVHLGLAGLRRLRLEQGIQL